jgi:pimeloyl-ACP methyl ester carboxylesterase
MIQFWIGLFGILIAITLAGIVTIVIRYRKEIHAARQRVDSLGSQLIETDRGPIEYALFGNGYPVLVVHGAMGGFDQGLWLAHGLINPDYKVISVSRFGYLRSSLPPGASLDMQADAFACLLDALQIRQVAVFGVSAGATSSIRFAARHPERVTALILLCPDAPGKVQMAIPPRFVFDTLLRNNFINWALVTYFGKWMQSQFGFAPKGFPLTPEYEAQIKNIQAGDLPVSQRMDGMIFESFTLVPEFNASITPDSPYPLNKIEIPVLVINAMDDPITIPENVRELANKFPDSRLFVVPDGGHFLFGHTEEVRSEITQFLRSHVTELQYER